MDWLTEIWAQVNLRNPPTVAGRNFQLPRKERGFSLFELTAFIIISAIIYSTAVNRFSDFPEAAERANFLSIITQVQTGLNLEVMLGLSSGARESVREFEGINPMSLMLQTPSNYLGAFGALNAAGLERRSWYFDTGSSELVYLVNQAENVFVLQNGAAVPTDEIRFEIVVLYRDMESRRNITRQELESLMSEEQDLGFDAESALQSRLTQARVSGAVLRPSSPFIWEGAELDLEDEF